MACCRTWRPDTLLLVVATLQLSHALRAKQITDRMPLLGNGNAEDGSGSEGSGEAVGAFDKRRRTSWSRDQRRRRSTFGRWVPDEFGNLFRSRRLPEEGGTPERSPESARESSSESRPESSSESKPGSESESEAEEDDLVVILEDHTDVMPPHLLPSELRAAYRRPLRVAKQLRVACHNCHNLQETASIKPELTKLDGRNGSEDADRGSQWSDEYQVLEAHAVQKKIAISNFCNYRIYWRSLSSQGSTEAIARGVVLAAEKVISRSLIYNKPARRGRKRSEERTEPVVADNKLLSLWSVLGNWKEEEGHVAATALRDACDAMFRKNMSFSSLQTLIRRYDKIINILTENVH